MRKLWIVLLFFLNLSGLSAQNGWKKIATLYMDARSLVFLDSLNGFVSYGEIYKTSDGGYNWTKITTIPENQYIDRLAKTETNELIGVGGGKIFRSTDYGDNWTEIIIGVDEELNSFYSTKKGCYFVTSTSSVFRSTDYGKTWNRVITGAYFFSDISFPNDSIGYVATRDTNRTMNIWKTTNGGATWIKNSTNDIMSKMIFCTETVGYGLSIYGPLNKTTNEGQTWVPVEPGFSLSDLIVVDENKLWGFNNNIIYTDNAFATWDIQYYYNFGKINYFPAAARIDSTLFAFHNWGNLYKTTNGGKDTPKYVNIIFPSEGETLLCGDISYLKWEASHEPEVEISFSTDYGVNWTTIEKYIRNTVKGWRVPNTVSDSCILKIRSNNFPDVFDIKHFKISNKGWFRQYTFDKGINDIHFTDKQNGWVAGSGGIYKTSDGGYTWSKCTPEKISFQAIWVNKNKYGWAGGLKWSENREPILFKTTDGGISWREIMLPPSLITVRNIKFLNNNFGWMSADVKGSNFYNRSVFKTTNGGEDWTEIISGTSGIGCFIDENNGWAAGTCSGTTIGLTFYKTTDGGATWKTQSFPECNQIYALEFSDKNTGWAAGTSLFKTTDGGDNWVQFDAGIEWDIYRTCFNSISLTNNSGWAVGTSVLKLNLDKKNWHEQNFYFQDELYSISFVDEYNGWATGSYDLYRTMDAGRDTVIINEEPEIPAEMELLQNYPNPFNPVTTIRYSIPETGIVTLKVYDILGREVSILVNEKKAAGFYEIEFNAAQLASGVYFYRIEAGKYSSTKKLVVLK